MTMTLDEFNEQRTSLQCRRCHKAGCLTTQHNIENNSLQVICATPGCECRTPLGGVINLKQSNRKKRPPIPGDPSLDEVWSEWGGHCIVCGLPGATLNALRIGRNRHHILPYAEHGHAGPVLPICVSCHEFVNALQRWTRKFLEVTKHDAA